MNSILGIKFRMAVFGLKSVCDSKDEAIFEAVIRGSEFEESLKTFEKVCEEACKGKQLKKQFTFAIDGIRKSQGAKTAADLFKKYKFEESVVALEKIGVTLFGKTNEYASEYQHFLKEIKRIADSQLKERKSGSVRMWIKIVFGAAAAAAVTAAYVKKRNQEKKIGEENSPKPG
ncbi:MAG: hypothetical protein CO141_02275 [Candidatus Moranbacteria bacterium CG_4_9_14_3_um_filter_42_9]|nr:MAG: hypothetical protein CO141_02275 [Candidatus Moranbacteria bacterium CG_4_9_14_3_um_filter_42_9]